MMRIGDRRDSYRLEIRFEMGGLDQRELHQALLNHDNVELTFMGRPFKVRLSELNTSYEPQGTKIDCTAYVLYE